MLKGIFYGVFGLINLNCLAQYSWNYENIDSLIKYEVKPITKVNVDSISSLLVYRDEYFNAKGFLVENNITGGTIDVELPIPICENKVDERLILELISDSTFRIQYKYRNSKDFIIDTCLIFSMNSSYFAIPLGLYTPDYIKDSFFSWSIGPTSNDERDVIQICEDEEGKLIFYPLR